MLVIFNVIFIAFIGGIIIFIRQYRIKKKAHVKELETKDILHKKELLKTQMEIQHQTMKYIGREIHDNIGQKLTLSSLYLQQLVFENRTQEITDNINTVNAIINESLTELRHLSKSLTNDSVAQYTLTELIDVECKKVGALQTHSIVFEDKLDLTLSSYQIKSILLRITQEFIQNSIKHANCDILRIFLSNTGNVLLLVLEDNGIGFDLGVNAHEGIGLKNIKRRIEMLKGESQLKSDKNGTTLRIQISV